ncbi:cyclase family protein [Gordonia sp. zg691]|uniref:Cyclase family protein n=1 Tax=Gordonia jinghuaiqii TaxID=2758710 RepID=A0A7D7LTH5_9ACTN|nr:cyclase family protein [Gordonia jinghuaiqii]MBD0862970.1 cyclase family protein [Gordonia jinghuaiqii]MCR5978903.1 cyclase family protein [Gordonia jinghuaiqii]QMT01757.1 cyclase family protein [Gordonia jinghuaiqii]
MCDDAIVLHAHEESRRMSRRTALRVAAGVATGVSASAVAGVGAAGVGWTAPFHAEPRGRGTTRIVDLTHPLSPSFPVWPGNPPMVSVPTSRVGDRDSGFATNWVSFAEHTGTHVDAPAHKIGRGITVDRIDPAHLVAPLVVISIGARAGQDPRTRLTDRDIDGWESRNGRIPQGALVALHTGWQPRTGGADAAGFSADAVNLLVTERGVVAIGTDTLSVDIRGEAAAHTAILGAGRYVVEAMAALDSVPPRGATVMVGAPRFAGGSGGPARVLAMV